MKDIHPGARLRGLLEQSSGEALVAPGCYDGITALLVEQAGFKAAYMSGLCVAATLGEPDVGVVGVETMVERARLIVNSIDIPLIVDADSGYGGAFNVAHATRSFEAAGAAAMHLEDQPFPKKCAAMAGKTLVPVSEMVARIKTALAARRSTQFMIIARTDAFALEGLNAAIARVKAYEEAGADATIVMSVAGEEDMHRITANLKRPTIVMMVEGLRPVVSAQRLKEIGYPLVVYPVSLLQAQAFHHARYLQSLAATGSSDSAAHTMWSLPQLADLLGLPAANAIDAAFTREAQNSEE